MAGQLLFRDFVFEPQARQLRRNGSTVEVPPKAFELLKILIEAHPRALSQQELYDALWPDTIVEIANLHNVVHILRAALGDTDRSIVHTVYGYGFSFAADVTTVDDVRTAPAKFELQIGDETIPLSKGVHVIGRDLDSLIRIEGVAVSRRHAQIIVTETDATLEDLGSKNGTFIDSKRIIAPVVLHSGDVILFADDLAAVFRAVPPPEPTRTSPGARSVKA